MTLYTEQESKLNFISNSFILKIQFLYLFQFNLKHLGRGLRGGSPPLNAKFYKDEIGCF